MSSAFESWKQELTEREPKQASVTLESCDVRNSVACLVTYEAGTCSLAWSEDGVILCCPECDPPDVEA